MVQYTDKRPGVVLQDTASANEWGFLQKSSIVAWWIFTMALFIGAGALVAYMFNMPWALVLGALFAAMVALLGVAARMRLDEYFRDQYHWEPPDPPDGSRID